MERKRGRRQLQLERDCARRQAVARVLDEQTEDRKARFLRQSGKRNHHVVGVAERVSLQLFCFHVSSIMEM